MFLLVSLVLGLSACSNASNDEAAWSDDNLFDSDSENLEFAAISEDFDVGDDISLAREVLPGSPQAPRQRAESTAGSTIEAERIIHRANIGIVVDDFDEGVEQVQELTAEFAGFIESSWITGETDSYFGRTADFTIRVPVTSYNEMLEMLTDLGEVDYRNTTAVNVSAQYADIVSRLTSLRTQEERVLELVESAENLADLLMLEARLGELIYEIEALTGERNHLDNLISYSTIDVIISEHVEAIRVNDFNSQSLGDVFMTSLRALGTFGGTVLRLFVGLIPWLIPFSIVFLAIRGIWRWRRGKSEDGEKKRRSGKKKKREML